MAESSSVHFATGQLDARQSLSQKHKQTTVSEQDVIDDVETGAVKQEERDFKRKQTFKGWLLLWLAYQSTGVIYGDIGTSPLYVYSSTFSSTPSTADIYGSLSLIIWSLTLIVTVKYVFIVLCADDEGEGGTFAVYSLLSRYSNIAERNPRASAPLKMERYSTNDIKPSNRAVRNILEGSWVANALLKAFAVFGVSLIMADGILTPAQSVLGAIQGLEVVVPDIEKGTIVGVSCAILVILFMLQPLGIHKLASGFAPIVIIWLLFNGIFGIYNLVKHDASVLKAFSPYFAGDWFVRNKTQGWLDLGGILLAFTGVEALFADLGAFSKRAIQLSWLCFCYPCLLLAYIGQAAYLMDDRTAYSNPFFKSVPPGMFYPSLVISILAAVVASQAIITSVFQLLSQVMTMSYFPHIKMIHSSTVFHGQVYVPMANWLMMIGTVIVTAVYSDTTKLGHAYGFCVIMVTFITTNLVALVALIVWRIHFLLVLAVYIPILTLDALFLTSACTKLPDGAWFTLLLAVILASIFILWRYGKEAQWHVETADELPASRLITTDADGEEHLLQRLGGGAVTTIKGCGIFFDKQGRGVPAAYANMLQKFEARPELQVFLHMRALPLPVVPEEDRYAVTIIPSMPNCYRLVIRHGYNDQIINEELGILCVREIRGFLIRNSKSFRSPSSIVPMEQAHLHDATPDDSLANSKSSGSEIELSSVAAAALTRDIGEETSLRIAALDSAIRKQTVYIVGKEELRILHGKSIGTWHDGSWWTERLGKRAVRRVILAVFLWIRENTRAKVSSMRIPVDKLVEVGFVKEM